MTRRIDRQTRNLDNPNILNTLRDLKVNDNAGILVETKNEDEPDEEPASHALSGSKPKKDDDVKLLDDTENIRTVIVNTTEDLEKYERY